MCITANTISTGEPDATEIGHVRFGKGPLERTRTNWHLAGGLLHVTFVLWEPGGETPPGDPAPVATRYDKRDYIFRGTFDVASIWIWLRDPVT